MKRKSVCKLLIVTVSALAAALVIGGYTYLNGGYPADTEAFAALESGTEIRVSQSEGMVVFEPEDPCAGLIFYPGGMVDHLAYAPLLRSLAQEGIACVLPEMPFDLAVLDMDAAADARGKLPEIGRWYIGGHSLGGAMAAAYAADHPEKFEGLVLLAAYATEDLRNSDMKVISLYGSEDKVLDMEKYSACRSNLPAATVEQVLEGGNHAQFGSYGRQKGDGQAAVSPEEQLAWTVAVISNEINDN